MNKSQEALQYVKDNYSEYRFDDPKEDYLTLTKVANLIELLTGKRFARHELVGEAWGEPHHTQR